MCAIWRAKYYLTKLQLARPEFMVRLKSGSMILPRPPVDENDQFGKVDLEWAQ